MYIVQFPLRIWDLILRILVLICFIYNHSFVKTLICQLLAFWIFLTFYYTFKKMRSITWFSLFILNISFILWKIFYFNISIKFLLISNSFNCAKVSFVFPCLKIWIFLLLFLLLFLIHFLFLYHLINLNTRPFIFFKKNNCERAKQSPNLNEKIGINLFRRKYIWIPWVKSEVVNQRCSP